MGKQIAASTTINRIRTKAEDRLMFSTCKLYPPNRKRTASGSYQEYASDPIEYRGSSDIPCRLDIARFFRSGDIENQAITVNDYELHVPFGVTIQSDYRIVIDNFIYEMRKDMGAASNTITKIYLITRLDTIKNPIPTTPSP